jgi:hypothetical protein
MRVFTVLLEDRHADAEVEVFMDREMAINRAKNLAKENDRHGEYEEQQISDWVFHATYSCEGDSVTVRETELQ